MDLLRKEMERKKRALAQAKSSMVGAEATVSGTRTDDSSSGAEAATAAAGTSARFLNASQLRKRQEEEEEKLRRTTGSKRARTDGPPAQQPQQQQRRLPPPSERHPATAPSTARNSSDAERSNPMPEKGKSTAPVEFSKRPEAAASVAASSPSEATSPGPRKGAASDASEPARDEEGISASLRSLGLPVRLFGEVGESGGDRRLERLRQALRLQQSALQSLSEKQEFRLGAGHGIRNPFLAKRGGGTAEARPAAAAAKRALAEDGDGGDVDDGGGDDDDPHKRIYRYLKSLLVQWERDLSLRPEPVKLSVSGKKETNTLQQCKDYIAPLFKLLKKRQLEGSLTANLLKIVDYCQRDEFVLANDAYMDVAIGRAAWPIGVTQVGIHSRTGRSKIESSNVAHVMNSELQRKYLTSVKRLMTYAQTKSAADPSKKVLN
jgi:pre-mRNA-splicing factor 18